jgi:hypothetical protein
VSDVPDIHLSSSKDYRLTMIDLAVFLMLLATTALLAWLYAASYVKEAEASRLLRHYEAKAPLPGTIASGESVLAETRAAQGVYVVRRLLAGLIVVIALCSSIIVIEGFRLNSASSSKWTAVPELPSTALRWFSSTAILFIVIAVVVMGILMSMQQFHIWMKDQQRDRHTKLSISATGVTIATPLVGLAVLAMSLGFLFLFVRFVY